MKSQNSRICIVILINLLLISLIALINSRLSVWGVFLYLPGLFIILSSNILDVKNGIVASIITGIHLDTLLHTPLGFHAILLAFIFLLVREWQENNRVFKTWRPIFLQIIVNIIFFFVWYFWLLIKSPFAMSWEFSRFFADLTISTLIMIPLGFWMTQLTEIFIHTNSQDGINLKNHS